MSPCISRRENASRSATASSVSRLLGIPVPTVRSWERRYGFPRPARTQGSHRRYDPWDAEQLRALRDEITAGIRAAEAVVTVRRSFSSDRERAEPVRAVLEAGLAYEVGAIRVVLNQAVTRMGLDETIQTVVVPALRELGTRWQVGACDVSQEHFTSQQIRTWLAGLLAAAPRRRQAEAVVLACGPQRPPLDRA